MSLSKCRSLALVNMSWTSHPPGPWGWGSLSPSSKTKPAEFWASATGGRGMWGSTGHYWIFCFQGETTTVKNYSLWLWPSFCYFCSIYYSILFSPLILSIIRSQPNWQETEREKSKSKPSQRLHWDPSTIQVLKWGKASCLLNKSSSADSSTWK